MYVYSVAKNIGASIQGSQDPITQRDAKVWNHY